MPDILMYVIKVSISLAAVYLFYLLLLSRLTFYQWNRWYLLGYAFICFFLPLMNIYGWMENHPGGQVLQFVPAMHSWTDGKQLITDEGWTRFDTMLLVFAAGAVLMLVRIAIQFNSLQRLHKRARLLTNDGIELYEVNHPILPFSFGSKVFIHPAQHDEAELKEIIRHELVHVKEHHTVDIVFAEILIALNWFNPFAWLLRQAIRQNLEFIADRQVLEHGLDRRQYQHLLLKVIGQQQFSIASHLNFSALKTRITMMNKIKSAKVHLIKFLFALPIVAVLLLAFRQGRDLQKSASENSVTAMDTLPAPISLTEQAAVNEKGYYLSIADNNGECIVIIKDQSKTLVKAVLLTDWNKDKEQYESTYGKIPPPPLAPVAPDKMLPPPPPAMVPPPPPPPPAKVSAAAAAKPAAAPHPPTAPRLPANVKSMTFDSKNVKVQLKNGKIEKYDLSNPSERAAFEKKYGTLPDPEAAPALAPVVEEVVIVDPVVEIAPIATTEPAVAVRAVSTTKTVVAKVNTTVSSNVSTNVNTNVNSTVNAVVSVENQPLYYIEGKEATQAAVNALTPDEISEMRVIKGKEAVDKYGQKGKNGVILIKLKKAKKISLFNPLAAYTVEKDEC